VLVTQATRRLSGAYFASTRNGPAPFLAAEDLLDQVPMDQADEEGRSGLDPDIIRDLRRGRASGLRPALAHGAGEGHPVYGASGLRPLRSEDGDQPVGDDEERPGVVRGLDETRSTMLQRSLLGTRALAKEGMGAWSPRVREATKGWGIIFKTNGHSRHRRFRHRTGS
jgi:hypothetical protein